MGTPGYKMGQVVEIEDKDAKALIEARYAMPVVGKEQTRETAVKTFLKAEKRTRKKW